MNMKQNIYTGQRKFLNCYFPEQRHEIKLIPDTTEARKKAINEGASHFDTLSFCRHPVTGFPDTRRFGDVYFKVHSPDFAKNKDQFEIIKQIIAEFFKLKLKIDLRSIRFNILGSGGIGIQIPAWILRLEDGTDLLLYIYRHMALLLSGHFTSHGFKKIIVQYHSKIEAKNIALDNLSNSLNAEDFLSASYDELIKISERAPQPYVNISLFENAQRIPLSIKQNIILAAHRKRTDEQINQLFRYCSFLNDRIKIISEKKSTTAADLKTNFAIDEQSNILMDLNSNSKIHISIVPDVEMTPVDNMYAIPSRFLRKILQQIDRRLGLDCSIYKWISPGDKNLCHLLKSLKMCTHEKCSRKKLSCHES